MPSLNFCGINLSGELSNEGDEKLFDFKEIAINHDGEINVYATAIYEFTAKRNQLEIRSSLMRKQLEALEFKDVIHEICATNETCWILLDSGALFSFDLIQSKLKELSVAGSSGAVKHVSCTIHSLFGITSSNQLITLSHDCHRKLHEFPKHQRVKKIVSGAEHSLLVTSNGDVFSFGCGLRGALGHGDVNSSETPKQIEALAGLKIVDVAAGAFHSVAISSFGDVYSWGWNTSGQLGLPKVAQGTFKKASESHQQVFTLPTLIELEDEEAIKSVHCGSKHTILRSERNRLFTAGLNNYGQLGLSKHDEDIDIFTEIPVQNVTEATKIVCGVWSTYLINP